MFQNFWQHTGNPHLDQQISDYVGSNGDSFRVRSKVQQSRTDKKGAISRTEIVQYIESLTTVEDLPKGSFEIPDCKQVGAKKMGKNLRSCSRIYWVDPFLCAVV